MLPARLRTFFSTCLPCLAGGAGRVLLPGTSLGVAALPTVLEPALCVGCLCRDLPVRGRSQAGALGCSPVRASHLGLLGCRRLAGGPACLVARRGWWQPCVPGADRASAGRRLARSCSSTLAGRPRLQRVELELPRPHLARMEPAGLPATGSTALELPGGVSFPHAWQRLTWRKRVADRDQRQRTGVLNTCMNFVCCVP